MKRKIAVFTGNRAEYGILYPVIKAIQKHRKLDYALIVSGAHLLKEYGETIKEIKSNGLEVSAHVTVDCRSTTTDNMVRMIGEITSKMPAVFKKLKPDIVLLLGDRMEVLACAISAIYMNIPVAHIAGGDKVDCEMAETSVRHAITKLSHIHFPTSESSKKRLLALGEEAWRIKNYGSPMVDNYKLFKVASKRHLKKLLSLDFDKPILVFTQHPVTMELEETAHQIKESLKALKESGIQTVITYPNNDAGGKIILKEILKYIKVPSFRIIENLGRVNYFGLLKFASAMIGNSSSGLLESPIFKIPAINIGTRQKNRIRSTNVIDVGYNRASIRKAIKKAVFDLEYRAKVRKCKNPFGTGNSGKKIAEFLAKISIDKKLLVKKITY